MMTEPSMETLYTNLHDRLCLFICGRMAYETEAEDILQDVFLRIHTHLDTVRDLDKLESWVYQIARNSISDYYRRRRDQVELQDMPFEDAIPEEDMAESMVPYIRSLVEALPEPYHQAILLTEYEGLSQKALAEHLGISVSGAKSRVQRAREKIKEMMLKCCHYEFDVRGAIIDYRQHCCCEDSCSCPS
jgi:RNA polymerase sigma-70 factor (ECF subfamily)